MAGRRENLTARRALVRPLACMHPHVRSQGAGMREGLAARLAAMMISVSGDALFSFTVACGLSLLLADLPLFEWSYCTFTIAKHAAASKRTGMDEAYAYALQVSHDAIRRRRKALRSQNPYRCALQTNAAWSWQPGHRREVVEDRALYHIPLCTKRGTSNRFALPKIFIPSTFRRLESLAAAAIHRRGRDRRQVESDTLLARGVPQARWRWSSSRSLRA